MKRETTVIFITIFLFILTMLGLFFVDKDLSAKHVKYATMLKTKIAEQESLKKDVPTPLPACRQVQPNSNP
jgi:regulatory protein YycI of two-component signal transduction system YycFG